MGSKSITQQLAAAMKADAMENYGEAFPIFQKLATKCLGISNKFFERL
ncbi:MAG: hypothetical protein IPP67_04775 [Rhodospirillaceae bacterium]|nr:hypothetical protein [Rhodospirillaceae bacterium]